ADDKRNFGVDRFADGVRGTHRRNVNDARVCLRFRPRFRDRVEHRKIEMRRAALTGRNASDHLGAVLDRLFGMECSVLAGETLTNIFRFFFDGDRLYLHPFPALTFFCAASWRSWAETTLSPHPLMIFFPRSTFVPPSLTPSGTLSPPSFTAATTPSAITSQR